MKRSHLWSSGLALLATILIAMPARAQLNMQMGNGWSMAFSGNVNGFLNYEKENTNGTTFTTGGLVGNGAKGFNIRTGLLPAFAVFSIKGRDNNRDLGATFGFAPEIQCGPNDNNYANRANCQGAQLDMRQVFMTVGGVHGGTLLMGRDLSIFGRQNILNDMTLFGTGPTGGPTNGGGTTLGRIGFGYNYPNFNAQMTWSSAAGKNSQFSIGLFDPSEVDAFTETALPRVEAEWTLKSHSTNFWLSGLAQSAKIPGGSSLTSAGGSGGIKWWSNKVTIVGSAFFGSGIGTTLNFLNATDGGTKARPSLGGYAQGMIGLNARTSLGVSYGLNQLKNASGEGAFKTTNSAIVAGLYNKYGKMLRSTLEVTYSATGDDVGGNKNNSAIGVSGGLLLLF